MAKQFTTPQNGWTYLTTLQYTGSEVSYNHDFSKYREVMVLLVVPDNAYRLYSVIPVNFRDTDNLLYFEDLHFNSSDYLTLYGRLYSTYIKLNYVYAPNTVTSASLYVYVR